MSETATTGTALTPERVLDAAEEVLRRYGPAKATVVDVARALGVSHGSVYRHFASKAELRDAVAERWLRRVSQPLAEVADGHGPAPERLRAWLELLVATKRARCSTIPSCSPRTTSSRRARATWWRPTSTSWPGSWAG